MWNSIANLKENLNKIALDVHDGDDNEEDELEIYGSRNGLDDSYSHVSYRRNSYSSVHSNSVSRSPLQNGIDSAFNPEMERYTAEIKRLQESEAEIKALSVNYAALLKEREDQISRLSKENGSLKQNLDATNAAMNASRSESAKALSNGINVHKEGRMIWTLSKAQGIKGSPNQSPKRQHKFTTQVKNRYSGNQTHGGQDGISNGITHAVQSDVLLGKEKTSMEMSIIRNELGEKISEIKRLQMELTRREDEDADDVLENLKRVIASLEKQNSSLKMEKDELEVALKMSRNSLTEKVLSDPSQSLPKHPTSVNEKEDSSGSFTGKEEMELSLQKLDKDLKETRRERDKALQELARLKQHLLEKEFEESEKMDEDRKIIEQLQETNEYQRAQILRLEKALKQAIASQEEIKMSNSSEILKSKEIIDDLNKKLANCISIIDAKNVELLNLQTALGQYYAEIEAKEHLEGDLARAREESAKISKLLKDADQRAEVSKGEKEEILSKLSQSENMLEEWKSKVNKLEEDNAKLRRALEQSMTRLNRMSLDSDYLVDRRIVIKLLVTYFQRNHSKEVLDLMVRMLGFSDEDKQRIGLAQHGSGKGVVRGVLGLPGRLVGGILGGGSPESPATMASEDQSFADLWVDFLLKENERERREMADDSGRPKEDSHGRGSNAAVAGALVANQTTNSAGTASSSVSRLNLSPSPNSSPFPSRGNFRHSEHFDSEFSTVPLTSSDNTPQISRLLPKY
uniref:GRIP domain-containing protein n=1 Tax=Fagus sylvatica TaxID=28930 RepID=A0A2N9FE33_FAGSY